VPKIFAAEETTKKSQPWEQLDEVIEEIMEFMIWSATTASEEQLSRRKEAAAAGA
jgi:hypothetical protein